MTPKLRVWLLPRSFNPHAEVARNADLSQIPHAEVLCAAKPRSIDTTPHPSRLLRSTSGWGSDCNGGWGL